MFIIQYFYLLYFGTASSTGVITYSKVRSFLKNQQNTITQYQAIETVNKTVMLTGNHLIFARKYFAKKFDLM